MYKVLLVDDEPTIREGLRTLIPWDELGFQVVATAANGQDAIQKHNQYQPHLMIVDIRMPGMDGLELISKLRETNPELHILILSGYADFDYAKQAITHQVDAYLLKPVDEDELIGFVQKIKELLSSVERERTNSFALEEWSREKIIQRKLTEESPEDLSQLVKYAGLDWAAFELVLIKLQSKEEINSDTVAAVKRMLSDLFDETGQGTVFSIEPYIGLLVKDGLGDRNHRNATYNVILTVCKELTLDFVAVTGGEVKKWDEINRSFAQAQKLMKYRFFYEGGQIYGQGDELLTTRAEINGEEEGTSDASILTDKLFLAVDLGNLESISRFVEEAGDEMRDKGFSEQELKTRFVHMATAVIGKLAKQRPEVQEVNQQYSLEIVEMYKEYRYRDLVEHAVRLFTGLADALKDNGTDKLISRMIDTIHRNYQENLKLETLAELFHYNSAYLGKLFKNATGDYFNTYLDKVRMEHAKAFLEQGDKVYQVAAKVGYSNVDYFHGKFRKYTGVSPSEYRKSKSLV